MMTLQDKNAIIYGAGGSLGGAVASALAGAGAKVFLTGLHTTAIEPVARAIQSAGGKAEVARVDALDAAQISSHLESTTGKAGSVDIVFSAIDYQPVQNIPLTEMQLDDFVRPVTRAMTNQFLIATAAARVMIKQRSGVILTLTASSGGIGYPYTGGFAPACSAIERFSSNLAAEVGVYGVRVVNIRSAGSPDSKVFRSAVDAYPDEMKSVLAGMEADTMLKRLPLMAEIANVAVFLASDLAATITGTTVDATCGTTAGLNYRVTRPA